MSNVGKAYGDLERAQRKINEKRDPEIEKQCVDYIAKLSGENLDVNDIKSLKNGRALCKAINKYIQYPVQIETGKGAFKEMSNVENFIKGCHQLGLKEHELFQVTDLTETKNVPQVVVCIVGVARELQALPNYDGPTFVPKPVAET